VIPVTTADRERAIANRRAWLEVLSQIERDLDEAEEQARRVAAGASPRPAEPSRWVPPAIDGPIPDDLLPRAHEIHRRQGEVRQALGDAVASTRQEQQLLASRPGKVATAAPAYVDITA
jgi:hypothetical protein